MSMRQVPRNIPTPSSRPTCPRPCANSTLPVGFALDPRRMGSSLPKRVSAVLSIQGIASLAFNVPNRSSDLYSPLTHPDIR